MKAAVACKYKPLGERIIRAAAIAQQVLLAVHNPGTEILASGLPRIFARFYRVPSNDPCKQSGTGLGLVLVQKLVEHLQGTIQGSFSAAQSFSPSRYQSPADPHRAIILPVIQND